MKVFINGRENTPDLIGVLFMVVNTYKGTAFSIHSSRPRAVATMRWEHQRKWPNQPFDIARC